MSTPPPDPKWDTTFARFHPAETDCNGVAPYRGEVPRSCPLCGRSIRPSLPRRHDDHSASRRVDVLLEEAPHLLADSHRRDLWNLRAVLLLALAILSAMIGYALAMLVNLAAAHAGYYLACVLVIGAAAARAVANGEARR